jgi:hypothetical protein
MRAHGDVLDWSASLQRPHYRRTGERTGQLGRVVVRRAAEFSAATGKIPQIPLSGGGEPLKTSVLSEIPAFLAGAGLALRSGEYHVFRAALFSIVLTLAAGQNASLLCKVWCHDATSAGCPHQDSTTFLDSATSPSVSADDNCGNTFVGPIAFVREDARRTAAAPDGQNALVVQRFQLAPSSTDLRPGFESGQRRPLEERPLVITLRI